MLAIIDRVDADEEILTLPAAAESLGLSHVTLWRLVKAGRLHAVQIGRIRGITRSELERFRQLDRPIGRPRKTPPAAPPGPGAA
jgi:excisionase family DNA binding protein